MTATTFANRHLTSTESKILGALLDSVGPTEILRSIGQFLAHEMADSEQGDRIRSALNHIAKSIATAKTRP